MARLSMCRRIVNRWRARRARIRAEIAAYDRMMRLYEDLLRRPH